MKPSIEAPESMKHVIGIDQIKGHSGFMTFVGSVTRSGRRQRSGSVIAASFCLLLWAAGGCMSSKITSPEQSGIEQLLLGAAADRALLQIDFQTLRERIVFVDTQYLDSYRREYITAALRHSLTLAGALLVQERDEAELILEPRVSALAIDESETMIGLPAMSIPVPMSGGLAVPEAALYKSVRQESIGKLAVTGYSVKHDEPPIRLGPGVGRAYYNRWRVLFVISFRTTDIPEK